MDTPPAAVETGARITAVILLLLIHFILAWDVYAGMRWGGDASVSVVLSDWVRAYPIIALTTGIVIGHIVWPLPRRGP
jgi:hypothetical protein